VNQFVYQVMNCESQYHPATVVMTSWMKKSMIQAPTRWP
jgi:hypothetical protein